MNAHSLYLYIHMKYAPSNLLSTTVWCSGYWKHDVVLIHDEDHECLVENYIKPQLTKEGYRICVMRPGHRKCFKKKFCILIELCLTFVIRNNKIQSRYDIVLNIKGN